MSSYLNTVVLKKEREKAKKKTLTFTLLTLPHSLSEPFSWREQAVMMSSLLERPTRQGTEGGLWPTACEEQSPPPPPMQQPERNQILPTSMGVNLEEDSP